MSAIRSAATDLYSKTRIWDASVLPPLEPDPSTLSPWLAQETSAEVDERGRLRDP
jgi:hypothetical protein